jgi:hypothetical protein
MVRNDVYDSWPHRCLLPGILNAVLFSETWHLLIFYRWPAARLFLDYSDYVGLLPRRRVKRTVRIEAVRWLEASSRLYRQDSMEACGLKP